MKKGLSADWHKDLYFKDNEPLKMYTLNSPLGTKGIEKRIFNNKRYFIANFARAIADLVYENDIAGLKGC
ncbi:MULTISPECIES: hypothetical protein [unclassified Campylobacter]|uniref:hypothetical protein n=1 Tax=unclassified Campylobacter TaxID=2593542 RepID=UPI001CC1DA0E|nr:MULTISPECIES: hypothetical protein [unclassified Campylobacter]